MSEVVSAISGRGREIVLDTETTGLSPRQGHRIIEIGCVEIINGELTGNYFHTYINPKRDVPTDAYAIHGIATEFLQDKPVFSKVVADFLRFIKKSNLVIHNAPFDLGFLNHELGLIGETSIEAGRVTDTLMMARRKFPGAPVSLDALCQRFNINLSKRDKHGALVDAELLAVVYLQLRAGVQAKLKLDRIAKQEKATVVRPIREFPIPAQELEANKKLIASIPKALWHANDS